MSWQDRLKQAAYTPASGVRFIFEFEDVSMTTEFNDKKFVFPDVDGAYIQRQGLGGRHYPMTIYLSGDNYDQSADTLYAALEEPGAGTLEHPVYGTKTVIPFGSIRRIDALKSAANQAVLVVDFWETIADLVLPKPDEDPFSTVSSAINGYGTSAAGTFADKVSVVTSSETVSFKDKVLGAVETIDSTMKAIVEQSTELESEFNAIINEITTNIDTLINRPLELANSIIRLTQIPAQVASFVLLQINKLDAFSNLISSIIGTDVEQSTGKIIQPSKIDNRGQNEFAVLNLVALSASVSSVESTLIEEYTDKPTALTAAERVLDLFDEVNAWGDLNRESLSDTVSGPLGVEGALNVLDTGETYQEAFTAVSEGAARLVQLSFSLLQERFITLPNTRNILELSAELYGETDSKLDFFIQSNDFTGDEIIELPAGRTVAYYV